VSGIGAPAHRRRRRDLLGIGPLTEATTCIGAAEYPEAVLHH